ncbi:MAG TPA: sulfite exporter TauE/SafE family protein [Candidatus Acetothermia bacterium]|nr:sulfite exporter TauE/SafE family protein [Candidatus Acetothermia bacterium]
MHFEISTFLTLFFSAIAIGGLASLLGVGGGIFMVPLLLLGRFVPTMHQATGTSIAGVVFTSLSGTIVYWLRRAINFRVGLVIMPLAILGAWTGAWLSGLIEARWLEIGFAALLLYPAGMMLLGKQPKEIPFSLGGDVRGGRFYATTVIVGIIAGAASGMFGIGGGTVMVPALAVFLGLDIVTAVATSLFVMIPSAMIGSYQHWAQGDLRPEFAIPLILGLIIGAQLGPRLGTRVSKRRLRQLFGVVLVYAIVNMILKAI